LVHLVTQFLAEMVVWNHDVPLFWPVITGLRLFRSDSERNRKPAMFVGSKTGDEDAPFVFVRVDAMARALSGRPRQDNRQPHQK
jgi:hypothetical protein